MVWGFLKTLTECRTHNRSFSMDYFIELSATTGNEGGHPHDRGKDPGAEVETRTTRQADQAVYCTNMSFPRTIPSQEERGRCSQAQLLSLQHGNWDGWK